jgi:hypothetical protein
MISRQFLVIIGLIMVCQINAEILPLDLNFNVIRSNVDVIIPTSTTGFARFPFTPTIPILSPANDIPCGGKNFCGEATVFKSDKEFRSFTDKNCQPILFDILPLVRS